VVNPILLIATGLGTAFLLPLFDRLGRPVARAVHYLTLLFGLFLSLSWLRVLFSGVPAAVITTGGWPPPIGINLRFGMAEAALVGLAYLTAILGALYLAHHEEESSVKSLIIQLTLVVGAVGLIMTRDLFNTFVFLEISGIGAYAILSFGREKRGLEAGFKYMLLGSAASVFVLLGVAFLYKLTGTLNIDDMAARLQDGPAVAGMGLVLLLLMAGLMAELKLFPFNGPAIDIYEGAEPGVIALLVGTTVNALAYTFYKILSLYGGGNWGVTISAIGMLTFVLANLFATRQENFRRMLGYSSSAQLGLLVFLLPFIRSGTMRLETAGLLLLNHTLAKAVLLWLAGLHPREDLESWRGAFRSRPLLRLALAAAVLAISGLPPFPGFWGKWQALVALASGDAWRWIIPLLVGSLLEFVYYFGFFRRVLEEGEEKRTSSGSLSETLGIHILSLLALAVGVWSGWRVFEGAALRAIGLLTVSGLLLVVLRILPEKLKAAAVLFSLSAAAYMLLGGGLTCPLWSLEGFFLVVAFSGALLIALAGLGMPAGRRSFWGIFLILVAGIAGILVSNEFLAFFVSWEVMTWASYLLVSQGRRGSRPGYLYMIFSGAAGFLILGGLMAAVHAGVHAISGLSSLGGGAAVGVWALLAAGFVVKAAAWGVHIWAPGAYAEAPDLFTPFLSGVLSKLPIFGLAALAARIGGGGVLYLAGNIGAFHVLAWLGGATAFGMTLLAVFQEDAKRMLAYSSVGQVGYLIMAFAVMTPLGWSAGLWHVVNHLLFKGLLFLAVAGVVYRTGTRLFADMGGLITRMPFSFTSVLIGIIALSGVPPLSGFAGKWLLYEALVERGWLLLAGAAMFASVIAFLYCFRLIHSIFLGQLKEENRAVREAPLPLLASQGILIAAIMVLSVWPRAVLEPAGRLISGVFGSSGLVLEETGRISSSVGYFNAVAIMILVGVLFVGLLAFLLFTGPKSKKLRQLDIVYAAEIPPPPEEIHYAWAFFKPYERAFAPLLPPRVSAFWDSVRDVTMSIADAGRRFYTGNAQTYLLYTLLFILVLAGLGLAG